LIVTDQGRFHIPSAPGVRIRGLGSRDTGGGPVVAGLQPA